MEAYLVSLEGQGDKEIFLVDKEIFDWINSTDQAGRENGETGWVDKTAPQRVVDALNVDDPDSDGVYVTSGTFDNDKALHAAQCRLVVDSEETPLFFSMKEFASWMKGKDITIVKEYEGGIY